VILVALALLGFGISDLVRWSPDRVEIRHATAAAVAGAAAIAAVAALSGMGGASVLLAGGLALAVLLLWSVYDLVPPKWAKPEYALALIVGVIVTLIALSGLAEPVGGEIATWYAKLGFGFTQSVSVDQFVLGVGSTLFLLGTVNRIVRFTLASTKASLEEGEDTLRGGRLLGPMERLIVAAAVVSGAMAGAGFVIAAKGLLRFREIRGGDQPKVDEITEYFLIGTFTSVVVAAAVGVLVLAAA
jgi:hypothetical protein